MIFLVYLHVMETIAVKTCGRSGCHDRVLDTNPRSGCLYYYCSKHREARKLDKKKQYAKFKDKYIEYGKRNWLKLKTEFLDLYGGCCNCCGESNYKLLTLDHIHGGGTQHRKKIRLRQIYKEAIDDYQPDKYQVLCYNCNFCVGMHGSCLHKDPSLKEKHSKLVTSAEYGNSGYYNYNLRVQFLDMYGRCCVLCGQEGNVFLTLDHILGDGYKDRIEGNGDGWLAYRKAIANIDFNKYRTLCCNCNMSKNKENK